MEINLRMSKTIYEELISHLLPKKPEAEEAAFVLVREVLDVEKLYLDHVESIKLEPSDFVFRSLYGIELKDEVRGSVIKRAHDLGASLVEFHSHPYPFPAEFSATDFAGLKEFVPHVRWRLKNKTYAAVVVAPESIDGLVWTGGQTSAKRLDAILTEGSRVPSTGTSLKLWEFEYEQ